MGNTEMMQQFEGLKVRTAWNEDEEKWYFSIVDVVKVLTDSADPKQYIKKMRLRDPELNSRWGTICTPTEMVAADGKKYLTQAASAEQIGEVFKVCGLVLPAEVGLYVGDVEVGHDWVISLIKVLMKLCSFC